MNSDFRSDEARHQINIYFNLGQAQAEPMAFRGYHMRTRVQQTQF